jgi:hypothetical protein
MNENRVTRDVAVSGCSGRVGGAIGLTFTSSKGRES